MVHDAHRQPYQPTKSAKHVRMNVSHYSAKANAHSPLIQVLVEAELNLE